MFAVPSLADSTYPPMRWSWFQVWPPGIAKRGKQTPRDAFITNLNVWTKLVSKRQRMCFPPSLVLRLIFTARWATLTSTRARVARFVSIIQGRFRRIVPQSRKSTLQSEIAGEYNVIPKPLPNLLWPQFLAERLNSSARMKSALTKRSYATENWIARTDLMKQWKSAPSTFVLRTPFDVIMAGVCPRVAVATV